MTKARKILYTISAGFVVGAVVGMLYAPTEGAETRRKLSKLKRKLGFGENGHVDDLDRETLHELRETLQKQLRKIDTALDEVKG